MVQQYCSPVWSQCDEEGFPLAILDGSRLASQSQEDKESGEWVQQEVFVLRQLPQADSSFSVYRQHLLQRAAYIHRPMVERHGIFRVYASNISLRVNGHFAGVEEVLHTRPSLTVHTNGLEAMNTRPMFQIPPEILNNLPQDTTGPSKVKIYYVSIWKEFIYGPSLLMLDKSCLTHQELDGIKPLTFRLAKFFNRRVVDWSLYVFFFGICFLYCLIFHDLLELGMYLLYGSHLSIHLLAIGSHFEVVFTGSFFQGPAYAVIRFLCQHCAQEENAKVMRRHMAKMRQDIMNAAVT